MTTSRTTTGRRLGRVASWSSAVAVAALTATALVGCTDHHEPAVANTYGSLPSWLATIPADTDGVLTGTAAHPALTSEGDTVRVRLGDGSTLFATVTGPVVPGEGLPHQGETTTCTWTVSLRRATHSVPVSLADMTTIDQLGNVYRLAPVAGHPAPPAVLEPGQRASFEVRTVMKVGEGVLRWAPDGSHVLAEWDFEVEND
ncbi:hypothetical protein [Curtobacterium sp. L1-20]|uniref:hypothetical protein n=1 Tax=Curtobacterium sp. L1-20 TaxID=3138181 RepID=UPI003B52B547